MATLKNMTIVTRHTLTLVMKLWFPYLNLYIYNFVVYHELLAE